jgi:hypothetical protein
MDKEDALALLDVMRMQTVHEPPRIDRNLLGEAFAEVMIGSLSVVGKQHLRAARSTRRE